MTTLISQWYTGNWNMRLVAVVGLLFGLYSYFIVGTVVTVNERKDIRTDIRSVQAEVSDLEISYFTLASQVDMHKATDLGFVNAAIPKFVYTDTTEERVALVR